MRRWSWALLAVGLLGVLAVWPAGSGYIRSRADSIRLAIHPLPGLDGPYGVWARTEQLSIRPSLGGGFSTDVRIWYPIDGDGRAEGPLGPQGVPSYWERLRPAQFVPGRSVVAKSGGVGRSSAADGRDGAMFPLVIYIPGLGGDREANSFAVANLVSRGYIVMAVHEASHQRSGCRHLMSQTECGLAAFDLSSQAAFDESLATAGRRVVGDAERISRIIDAFQARQSEAGWFLRGRVDFTRIGALGYSLGGAVSMQLLAADPRIKSAVNLDGWLLADAARAGVDKPLLVMNSRFPAADSVEQAARPKARLEARQNLIDFQWQLQRLGQPGYSSVAIDVASHADFTDMVYSVPVLSWSRGQVERRRRWGQAIDHCLSDFFGQTLIDQAGGRIGPDAATFPEVVHLADIAGAKRP